MNTATKSPSSRATSRNRMNPSRSALSMRNSSSGRRSGSGGRMDAGSTSSARDRGWTVQDLSEPAIDDINEGAAQHQDGGQDAEVRQRPLEDALRIVRAGGL